MPGTSKLPPCSCRSPTTRTWTPAVSTGVPQREIDSGLCLTDGDSHKKLGFLQIEGELGRGSNADFSLPVCKP
jgi:hypothetical protein